MELISRHICMARDIGIHGNLFGGIMMAWLDEAGAILTSQAVDSPYVVTASIDKIEFKHPVKIGNIIYLYGKVLRMGNSSITIQLEARKHNVVSGKQKVVCCTEMVFVHIDQDGDPLPISEKARQKHYGHSEFEHHPQ